MVPRINPRPGWSLWPLGFLSFILLFFGNSGWPQHRKNEIEGRVTTPDQRPVDRMPIILLGDDYTQLAVTYTDGGGRYRFSGLSQGTFYLQIEPKGNAYQRQTFRVEVGDILTAGGQAYHLEIQLKPVDAKGSVTPPPTGTGIFHQRIPPEALGAFDQASASLQQDDFAAAERSFKRALEIFPDYYDALDRLGSEYVERQNCKEAIPLLRHATEVNKNGWHAYYSLGVALSDLGQREEGIAALRRAVGLNPQSPNCNMRLAMALAGDPRTHAEAIQSFVKTTQLAGKDLPDAYFYLASLYNKQEKYAEAADALESYLGTVRNVDPNQKEQYAKAIAQLRKKAAQAQKKP